MSCGEIQDRLSDYCDGVLSRTERSEVDLHLEACAGCRRELATEREVIRRAAAWRRDIEPERDLWPDIEARIRSRPAKVVRGPWLRVWRIGLAAAAALFAAVALMSVRQEEPRTGVSGTSAAAIGSQTPVQLSVLALASERARVEGGLMHVREDLLRSIGTRRGELDDETQEMVDRNLRIIDQAIGEIYQALEENPQNRVLEQLLAATHQREAGFLKQIKTL